ncbi:MAG: 2OG-Fe(II) oxygenase, partial [Pseudomonadales bacterium]|nr:2OG-Fe(II) oxygenase [Pseudomonadales bacterium]
IAGWYLQDDALCTDLIRYHANSNDKREGLMTGSDGSGEVDKTRKDSIDVNLPPCELANRYIQKLNMAARAYIEEYPYSNKLVPWGIVEPMAIQYYAPGGGYKAWHFERDNRNEIIARRHLAFMTYLNDVEDGGGTMFLYQDLKFKAQRGLTLIWPAEWMFTHKGEVSDSQEKYIITGWFSTYTKEQFQALRAAKMRQP